MAKFHVNTIRSSDKGARKAKQIAEFVNPNSASQIFLANINIMSTGVNLQQCCHIGIAINFHHNAKTIRQMHHRLHRIGQTKDVVWHTLKVVNSFHDHQERLCLTKWARQMSAEMSLPDWFPDNIREVVIFEFQRMYFHHPFNRYAWILLRDLDPANFDYNSDYTITMGHALTCVAKLCLEADSEKHTFWQEASENIALALVLLIEKRTPKQMQDISDLPVVKIMEHIMTALQESLEKADQKAKSDSETNSCVSRVKSAVEKRKKEFKSEEFIIDSDVDSDEDEMAGVESDIEEMDEDDDGAGAGKDVDEVSDSEGFDPDEDEESPDGQLQGEMDETT